MDHILAVDPGGDTGIATFDYRTGEWRTREMPYDPIALHSFFFHWMAFRKESNITIICESFNYRPVGKYDFGGSRAIPKVDLTPVRVIGILDLATRQQQRDIHWQQPSCVNGDDGKKSDNPDVFWTDEKVKKLGLYKAASVHAMDAVKHILYYRAFTLGPTEGDDGLLLFRAVKGMKFTETMTNGSFEELLD
jgi:hypothetical protein